MLTEWWSRIPVMLGTLLLMVFGGIEYANSGSDAAAPLIVGGLILLGVWVAMEVIAFADRRRDRDGEGD